MIPLHTLANETQPPPTLPLSEVFGPTWQGEGPATGRTCGFLRLGLCNLTCEWCDTPFTWDRTRYDVKAENPDTPLGTIARQVLDLDTDLLILSGGEPLIHALPDPSCALGELLIDYLEGLEVHVETNGTLVPPPWLVGRVEHFTVSPKIGTRDPEKKRVKPKALERWAHLATTTGKVAVKYVCATPDLVDEAAEHATRWGFPPSMVWIMPEGTEAQDVLTTHRTIAPRITHHGLNTTTRLHTLLWGTERGR